MVLPQRVTADETPSLGGYQQLLPQFGSGDLDARSITQSTWQKVCFELGRAEFDELRKQACEKMCASLTEGQSQESALFLLRQLERIGRDESVVPLQKLISTGEPIVADAARRALQNNGSAKANDALISLLDEADKDELKINLINSLGYRGESKAVPVLIKQLASEKTEVQLAAAKSLSGIDSSDAAKPVFDAWKSSSDASREQLAVSVIACAGRMIHRGEVPVAVSMLTEIYESSKIPAIRASALQGRLATSPDDAVELMINALNSDYTLDQQLAIGHVRMLKPDGLVSLIEKLPSMPASGQAGLLLALGTSRVKASLPAIEKACHSDDPVLKIAAITAMGHVGSAANAQVLLDGLSSSDELRVAASKSLGMMFDDNVDGLLVQKLATLKAEDERAKLIDILSARRTLALAQIIVDSNDLISPNAETRKRAIGVLNRLGDESHVPALVNAMATVPAQEKDSTAKTIVNICDRNPSLDDKAVPVVRMYSAANAELRPYLLSVAGRIGGKAASDLIGGKILSTSAAEKDAAITALCNWPNASVCDQLLTISKSGDTAAQRSRAIRAIARVVVLPSSQYSLDEQLAILKQTMALATQDDDRKLIIDRAKAIGLDSTVKFVRNFMTSPTLGAQAESALVHLARISELRKSDPSMRAELERVLKTSSDPKLRERAKQLLLEY